MQAACYMPPPKRPKSDVPWTTLCSEAENCVPEQKCNNGNNLDVVSVNAHHVDGTVATLNNGSSTPCTELVAAVSDDLPLDLRRTDAASAGGRHNSRDASVSRRYPSSTTLRRLLLEPLTSASSSCRSLPTTSSQASASYVAVETFAGCPTTAADVVQRPARCRASLNGVCLCPRPVTDRLAAARRRQADIGLSMNLPSAALRHILLNDDDCDDPHLPVTTSLHQSRDHLFVRRSAGLDRSPVSAESAVACSLPRQSATSFDNGDSSQALFSKHAQPTGRLECRDSGASGEESKYTEQRHETSDSLK